MTFIVYGFYLVGGDKSGTTSLIIGAVLGTVGSYFKYVSNQTVKSVKK